jgi:hypothetical protein
MAFYIIVSLFWIDLVLEYYIPSSIKVLVIMAAGKVEMGSVLVPDWIIVYSRMLLKNLGDFRRF